MNIETDAEKYLSFIPKRLHDSNKGTYGKILILAGSQGMSGAAYLSALAAYRSGAGLVKFLTHKSNQNILQTLLPEAIFEGYDSTTPLSEIVEKNVSWADIIVLGPGLGTSDLSVMITAIVLDKAQSIWPGTASKKESLLIVDADGLNILSSSPDLIKKLDLITKCIPVVITPHPMEMSRLTREPIANILNAPAKYASDFSKKHTLITILKGSQTIISAHSGDKLFKNTTASPALSKGGSGDVLSGAIAGIYSIIRAYEKANTDAVTESALSNEKVNQNSIYSNNFETLIAHAYVSAVLGVIIHNEAGRYAARTYGVHGVLARDTANSLGYILEIH